MIDTSLAQTPDIVFDHDDFCVLNKPAGWTIQRDREAPSLLEWLGESYNVKPYPVHRLDKPTTGLVLVAKSSLASSELSQQFQNRSVQKTYLAISDLKPKKKQGWVKGDMATSRRGQWKLLRTMQNPAITQFESTALADGFRGYYLTPHTGKTHQLRVMMKSLSAPILGDSMYGGSPANRLYLHAWRLSFSYQNSPFSFESAPTDGLFGTWHGQGFAMKKEAQA